MRDIKYIVVHHTAVDQPSLIKIVASMNRTHKQRGISKVKSKLGYYVAYHYVIGVKGSFKQTRLDSEIGHHASNRRINNTSIGIVLSGNLDKHPPTKAQTNALDRLIKSIKLRHGHDVEVVYHNMYAKKTCPGTKFPYDLFSKYTKMASKFKKIFDSEVKDPIFTVHGDKDNATIADVKYLMEIGIHRSLKKMYTYINKENAKDRSFSRKILSFLKLK